MEDYEAQEQEFWRKLEEGEMSRSQMLKRSVAAAAGLTVLGSTGAAFASRGAAGAAPPLKGSSISDQGARCRSEEGRPPQHDRPAARLGQLRRDDVDVPEEVRHRDHERQPERQLGRREPGDRLPEGRLARSRRGRRRRLVRRPRCGAGPVRKYFVSTFSTIPRAMKDTRGLWWGDYWGAISIGYNGNLISNPPKTWKDLLKPEYKGKVAHERQPAVVELRGLRRHRGGDRERRLDVECRPGHRLLRDAEEVGQLHPRPDDTADGRVRSDADLDRLGLQQPRLH